MSLKQLVGIAFLLILHASALFAQPGPLLMMQNSNLVISVSTLLSNGVPGFTNSAATLTLGAVSQSAYGGKVSRPGIKTWVQIFNGSNNDSGTAKDAVVDGKGNVLVTGNSSPDVSGSDFVTIKYSPDGRALWTNQFNGPTRKTDWAHSVAVDAANNVYVYGEAFRGEVEGRSDLYNQILAQWHRGLD